MSAFYIWNPMVTPEDKRKLHFFVTNGDVPSGIFSDKNFGQEIVSTMGINKKVADLKITAYRSSYFSEYMDSDDWQDVWQIVWRWFIHFPSPIGKLQELKDPWLGINFAGKSYIDSPEDEQPINCLVIADFDTRADLEIARNAINSKEVVKYREIHKLPVPHFYESIAFCKYHQLQIDLGRFENHFYLNRAEYATMILERCRKAGGTTNHLERL